MNLHDPVDVLARTIWGEARGDGRAGMTAVACVVLNRAAHPRWWGDSVLSVCLDPWQFSCWNKDDPNLPKMQAVDGSDRDFVAALAVAADAVAGRLTDPTGGADSYFAAGSPTPRWAYRASYTTKIRRHLFWRVELGGSFGQPEARNVRAPDPPPAAAPTAEDLNAAELRRLDPAGAAG